MPAAGSSAAPGNKVTMAMIADEAGVSLPTVSKVLNGRSDVSETTRAAVEKAIRHSGYRRRKSAARPTADLLEVAFHELESPWAVELLRGVQAAARSQQIGVVVSELGTSHTPAKGWVDAMLSRRPAGVVLVLADLAPEQRAQLAARNLPYVVIEPVNEVDPGTAAVGSANWRGGRAATVHLIELGHRRIGIIGGPASTQSSRMRVDGYLDALRTNGLPADPELIRHGDYHVQSGYESGLALLRLPEPPTAIFAGSDLQAMGVYRAAREAGVRIPEDLSVVGYDDLPIAAWMTPALTTIHQPLFEMAELATRLALQLGRGEDPGARQFDLSVELVTRQSAVRVS